VGKLLDLTGQKFGRLTAMRFKGREGTKTLWECVCECGNSYTTAANYLRTGDTKSCGCLMQSGVNKLDITGEVYGQLTAISNTGKQNANGCYIWNFKCSCGELLEREIGNLRHRRESAKCDVCNSIATSGRMATHRTPKGDKVYTSWRKIKERCFNPNDKSYKDYGAVGITLCDEWREDFTAFRDHIGQPPKDGKRYSVDRIDNNIGYFPNNVRWATDELQARNKTLTKSNITGIVGVYWDDKKWPNSENSTLYAIARWNELDGRPMKKSFSAKKYGEELAFFMACEYREQQINLLNLQGAGYTEGHGKVRSVIGAII
jgi:hypothetical protein